MNTHDPGHGKALRYSQALVDASLAARARSAIAAATLRPLTPPPASWLAAATRRGRAAGTAGSSR